LFALRTIFIAAACRDRARRLVLPKGGSFLNHGQPCRRQFRSSSNDVSFPLKSYADWPQRLERGEQSQKCLLADISGPAIRGTKRYGMSGRTIAV
jgi:hypothetical protein